MRCHGPKTCDAKNGFVVMLPDSSTDEDALLIDLTEKSQLLLSTG